MCPISPSSSAATQCLKAQFGWDIASANGSLLRRLPVEGVDFLGTDVAQRERRIVGGKSGPRAERPGSQPPQVLQAAHTLQLVVADAETVERPLASDIAVKVEVLSVPRPIYITNRHLGPVSPRTGLAFC